MKYSKAYRKTKPVRVAMKRVTLTEKFHLEGNCQEESTLANLNHIFVRPIREGNFSLVAGYSLYKRYLSQKRPVIKCVIVDCKNREEYLAERQQMYDEMICRREERKIRQKMLLRQRKMNCPINNGEQL